MRKNCTLFLRESQISVKGVIEAWVKTVRPSILITNFQDR